MKNENEKSNTIIIVAICGNRIVKETFTFESTYKVENNKIIVEGGDVYRGGIGGKLLSRETYHHDLSLSILKGGISFQYDKNGYGIITLGKSYTYTLKINGEVIFSKKKIV